VGALTLSCFTAWRTSQLSNDDLERHWAAAARSISTANACGTEIEKVLVVRTLLRRSSETGLALDCLPRNFQTHASLQEVVRQLAMIGCTTETIAQHFHCSRDTIENRFRYELDEGSSEKGGGFSVLTELRLEIPTPGASPSRVRGLMHDGLSHSFNLVDGVFPGLRTRQDLVYVLEKRRRQLVVIGPGDG
jgi:AraC-like DNA-binding protein